jgi:hypothetical protein
LQYEFADFFSLHFQDEESLERVEEEEVVEVEHVGQKEDLEVAGLEETPNRGQDSKEEKDEQEDKEEEEEGHEEGVGLEDEGGG